MSRYFAETYTGADGEPVADPVHAAGGGDGVSRVRHVLVPFGTRPEVVKLAPVVAALQTPATG